MKNKNLLWILILLLAFGSLFGNKINKPITKESTIRSVSQNYDVPMKKLRSKLNVERIDSDKTFTELGIPVNKVKKTVDSFNNNRVEFNLVVVFLGMVVVFFSLVLIGFIISQLKQIDNVGKKQTKKIVINKVKTSPVTGDQISANAVVAAITALHLYVAEIDETNKLLLTWKRTSLNLWRYYYKFKMPNREFSQLKRR